MPNKPNDSLAKETTWYLAELIVKITVEGDARQVVHKNLMLISGDTPVDAYEAAVSMGNEHSMSYENPHHRQVNIQFVGLSRLVAVHDHLEHGAELIYEEHIGMSDEQVKALVVPKDGLSAFSEITSSASAPDYSSGEILEEASRLIRRSPK